MAFLAVLKEGFETAVFLLAAAQTAQGSRWFALFGGVRGHRDRRRHRRRHLRREPATRPGRFFHITGVFLVFIAAGLVMSSLRTAHEAGWIELGQARIVDLSAVLGPKSVAGSGRHGHVRHSPDPRLIEVLGWLLYAVPVLVVFLWPARLGPAPASKRRLTFGRRGGHSRCSRAPWPLIPAGSSPAPGPTRTARTSGGGTVTAPCTPTEPSGCSPSSTRPGPDSRSRWPPPASSRSTAPTSTCGRRGLLPIPG